MSREDRGERRVRIERSGNQYETLRRHFVVTQTLIDALLQTHR